MQLHLDMFETAGVGVLALMLGLFLTRKVPFLRRFCVPAAVSGGLLFSLLILAIYGWGGVEMSFDGTLKDICMMVFFTSVGFQSNFKVLRQGGRPLLMMVLLVAVLIVLQDLLSVGIAKGMGLSPLLGMAAGSITMTGGHGTAGGFSSLLETMGLSGASSITMAAATFGLVAGSLMGGPLAEGIIRRRKLAEESTDPQKDALENMEVNEVAPEARELHERSEESEYLRFTKAVFQLLIALAAGALLSRLLALTGITFPTYFGALLAAAAMRNLSGKGFLELDKIISIGNVCLSLFLGMAMVSLRLWELADLALPLLAMLCAQVLMLALFARLVAFPLLGRDYDAAVLVSGLCGFGLGATPNAMANMSAVCYKYSYAVRPFIIVPVVGAMFVDIINTTVITIFLNLI